MEALTAPGAGPVIAIVGGGFSGTLVAVHLARLSAPGRSRVVLFEKGDRFARGLAYGTLCDEHLLNVPAAMMSALPDEPDHFLDWLRGRDPSAQAGTFAPRRLYGEYLEDLLRGARGIELVRDEVVAFDPDRPGPMALTTRGGMRLEADRAVLALGHPAPQDPAGLARRDGGLGYVGDPWSPEALDGLGQGDPIALIGTGLTAVDLIVEARSRGHRGRIVAISRRGLLPCRHQAAPPRPHFHLGGGPATARSLLRTVRSEADRCLSEGGDWRSVVDSVRPVAQEVWRSLGDGERSRFLRHLAPRWDVHRHRVAPRIDDLLQAARREGRLEVIAGRVLAQDSRGGGEELTIRRRGAPGQEVVAVRRVINCTGPARDIRDRPSPLMSSLLAGGLARPGPLALGPEVADHGALVGRGGRVDGRVFALGPLLKEQLWETTAVRELRVQARDLARHLLGIPAS